MYIVLRLHYILHLVNLVIPTPGGSRCSTLLCFLLLLYLIISSNFSAFLLANFSSVHKSLMLQINSSFSISAIIQHFESVQTYLGYIVLVYIHYPPSNQCISQNPCQIYTVYLILLTGWTCLSEVELHPIDTNY